jgi:hypothetical protein
MRGIDGIALLNREGEALARPCVYLRRTGREYAGVWDAAPAGRGARLLFDASRLPFDGWRKTGCISVSAGSVVFQRERALPDDPAGLPLYAHRAVSLPPLDAIFRFGSSRLQEWLQACNWKPEWGYNANFPDRAAAEAYERSYQSQLPLYTREAHAVLGGWHFPWPDGDWADLVDASLLAWTFEGAEPWLEAWEKDGRRWVLERGT